MSVTISVSARDAVGAIASTTTVATIGAVPVCTPINFTLPTNPPVTTIIGSVSATNTPTSFSIISGNSQGYFAIGQHHTKIVPAVIPPDGVYGLTVAATNAVGTGPAVPVNITVGGAIKLVPATFTPHLPVVAGQVMGTASHTGGTPDSWAITAGDPKGFFSIDKNGVIRVTVAGAADTTSTIYNLTCQATNFFGAVSGMWRVGPLSVAGQTDPWAALDGRLNAPVGPIQFPTLLNGYPVASPPNARTRWPNNGTQPPWEVAGVDYYVGVDRNLYPTNGSLKDPRVGGNLPAGASYLSGIVTVSSDNVTLDGFDFSLDGVGMGIAVGDGSTSFPVGTIISNCYFQVQSNSAKTPINIRTKGSPWTQRSGSTTVFNCEFDGGALAGFTNASQDMIFWQGGGTFTCLYCYIHNVSWHGIDFQSNNTTTTPIVKYNVFSFWGVNGGHGNAWYFESNSSGLSNAFSNGNFDFNLIHQPNNAALTGQDSGLSIFTTEAAYITIASTTGNYNTILNQFAGGAGLGAVFSGNQTSGNGSNIDMNYNYYDPTHATTVWAFNVSFPYTGVNVSVGSINMVNGAAAPAHPT